MKKKRLLSMLLAATLLFSLTACARTDNGEEPSDEQPSQGTTSQAPADPMEVSQGVTDDTIKIGTISLVSGAFAYIGQPAYDGLRACIERFNAQGGVQGRKLEIVAYDDQYDAATGKAIVERMVEQDQVFALVGLGGNIVETSLDYLKEKGIPVINISSGLDSVYAENDPSSNIFQIQPANMTDARNLIARVLHESIFGPNKDEKLPADAKIAVVHGTDSASMSSLEHLKEIAEEEGATDRLVIQASPRTLMPPPSSSSRMRTVRWSSSWAWTPPLGSPPWMMPSTRCPWCSPMALPLSSPSYPTPTRPPGPAMPLSGVITLARRDRLCWTTWWMPVLLG